MNSKNYIEEKDVYRACIILSVIGLGIIHISHSYLEPTEAEIQEIDETWIGETVELSGEIEKSGGTENVEFYDMRDGTGEIQLVDFDDKNLSNSTSIVGNVDVHQGSLQVVVESRHES